MSKEEYKLKYIHDVVNDQGFAMHYRVISKHGQPFGSFLM